MLLTLGVILVAATIAAVVVTIATTLFATRAGQVAAATAAGAWIGFLVEATTSGAVEQLSVLLMLFVAPLFAAIAGSLLVPEFRERLLNVPRRLIIGLNLLRVLGFLFIGLAYAGALGGPFPFSAGYGDIATGLLAIPLAFWEPKLSKSDWRIVLWNTFGTLDLIAAVALGVLSRNGSPIQLIHAGAGSAAITQLPWSLIPLFLVPCYLIGHAMIYGQMLTGAQRASIRLRTSPNTTA